VRKPLVLVLAVSVLFLVPVAARADHAGRISREEWISTSDPLVTLHADVDRGSQFGWDQRQPVILVATPYGNHSGQTDADLSRPTGTNGRFDDFLELSNALARGYTYAVVDLPGFGGSSGCGDLGGPLERAAVKRAVEWAAAQPWSSGQVALFGKSYDAWTGLMGVADRPQGLAAVVAMEPVYSPYTVDFANGVRNVRSFALPGLYAQIEAEPGTVNDSPAYQANSVIRPQCYAWSQANWVNDDGSAAFWQERNLPADSVDSSVPLFVTQGLLETNTVPRGAVGYFNRLGNPGNRAWFGQFGHVRGWESDAGRTGFVDEVMRFLDSNLMGIQRTVVDPKVSVQDSLGRYRGEASWPPADAAAFTTTLRPGSYVDANDDVFANAVATIDNRDLPHAVWMAGEPHVTLTVNTLSPRTNISVRLYDVGAFNRATEVTREAYLIRNVGRSTIEFDLMGQDWIFEKGHRIAVEVGMPSTNWFVPLPTGGNVQVEAAQITLPFLTQGRTAFQGGRMTRTLADAHWPDTTIAPWTGNQALFSIPGPIDIGPR
jgi:predicted acyl esterase